MVLKLSKVLCCIFLFSFLALTLHKTQKLFTIDQGIIQSKCFDYMSAKIVHCCGPSTINLGILVGSCDVCRAS